jgi:hypothetical protein
MHMGRIHNGCFTAKKRKKKNQNFRRRLPSGTMNFALSNILQRAKEQEYEV